MTCTNSQSIAAVLNSSDFQPMGGQQRALPPPCDGTQLEELIKSAQADEHINYPAEQTQLSDSCGHYLITENAAKSQEQPAKQLDQGQDVHPSHEPEFPHFDYYRSPSRQICEFLRRF
jgi:hypothetical protein